MERICIHNKGIVCSDARCSIKCGWNPRGTSARHKEIITNGLAKREDGLQRLVVKGGTGNARSES